MAPLVIMLLAWGGARLAGAAQWQAAASWGGSEGSQSSTRRDRLIAWRRNNFARTTPSKMPTWMWRRERGMTTHGTTPGFCAQIA